MAAILLILAVLSATVEGYPWGGVRRPFDLYQSNMQYVIRPSEIERPSDCSRDVSEYAQCVTLARDGLEMFQHHEGRMPFSEIMGYMSLNKGTRICVTHYFLAIQKSLYITEADLHWLLQLNILEAMAISTGQFSRLDNSPAPVYAKLKLSSKVLYRESKARSRVQLPRRPTADSLQPRRCDIQLWYTDILMLCEHYPLSAAEISVVPSALVFRDSMSVKVSGVGTVLAPSREVMLYRIDQELQALDRWIESHGGEETSGSARRTLNPWTPPQKSGRPAISDTLVVSPYDPLRRILTDPDNWNDSPDFFMDV